jgi:hypothetical protein
MKYMVITKVYDNGRAQVLKPQPSTVEKSYNTHKFNYDFYVDVFETYGEAELFYRQNKE